MRTVTAIVIAGALILSSCAGTVLLNPGAEKVIVGKNDPTDNFVDVGPVSGHDGQGCGLYGYRGTYERAIIDIKNKAFRMGGNYVQIFTITEPHFRPGCYDNNYIISGTAYRKVREYPSPSPRTTTNQPEKPKTLTDQLRELLKLKDDGLLSEEEYQAQRRKALERQ